MSEFFVEDIGKKNKFWVFYGDAKQAVYIAVFADKAIAQRYCRFENLRIKKENHKNGMDENVQRGTDRPGEISEC